jgi:adenosylcobyric acid synthase
MLGRFVHDPQGCEGNPGSTEGLNLLPIETVLQSPKTTSLTRFAWEDAEGSGYEIHMGKTTRYGGRPLLRIRCRNSHPAENEDGCIADGARVMGTYIHGWFDSPDITRRWLAMIGLSGLPVPAVAGLAARNHEYNRLADHFAAHVDESPILKLAEGKEHGVKGADNFF